MRWERRHGCGAAELQPGADIPASEEFGGLWFHPHIHYMVPGGALSTSDKVWHPSSPTFYLPVKALSKIFREKFRVLLEKEGVLQMAPPSVWTVEWNVNCQAFLQHVLPSGLMKIRYYGFLSPYSKVPLEEICARIELRFGFDISEPEIEPEHIPSPLCPKCGGELIYCSSTLPHHWRTRSGRPAG